MRHNQNIKLALYKKQNKTAVDVDCVYTVKKVSLFPFNLFYSVKLSCVMDVNC